MTFCKECNKALMLDEISLYRRLIYREAAETDCLCIPCLAKKLGVSEKDLEDKIKHFRDIGCTLFV